MQFGNSLRKPYVPTDVLLNKAFENFEILRGVNKHDLLYIPIFSNYDVIVMQKNKICYFGSKKCEKCCFLANM